MTKLEEFKEDIEALCRQYWGKGFTMGTKNSAKFTTLIITFEDEIQRVSTST